jgi:hypothetical protein
MRRPTYLGASLMLAAAVAATGTSAAAAGSTSKPFLDTVTSRADVASTVPSNGDVNPYGVAVVPVTRGRLHEGSVLVSNFNDQANLQGTGTTIVQVSPSGRRTVFARVAETAVPGGVGLTTALVALKSGWVIVGNLPTTDGSAATARPGGLLVFDDTGRLREILSGGGLNGPWDMTAIDNGHSADLFVSNVLNGTAAAKGNITRHGTLLRIHLVLTSPTAVPRRSSTTIIGDGFAERSDPAALVVGPTGLGFGSDGTLYVADTVDNTITMIRNAQSRHTSAGRGDDLTHGGMLAGPLGLSVLPGGDVLTANSANGKLVETSPAGRQVAGRSVDDAGSPPGAGALFGLAADGNRLWFVEDVTNTLDLLR